MKNLKFSIFTMLFAMTASFANAQDDYKSGTVSYAGDVYYNFIPKADLGNSGMEYNQSPLSIGMSCGAKYYFDDKAYASARLGFNINSSQIRTKNYGSYKSDNYTIESSSYFVTLPLELGYRFKAENSDFFIAPFAGIDVNCTVGGKVETKELAKTINKQSVETGQFGFGGKLGAKVGYDAFAVFASYTFPLGDKQKEFFGEDAYFTVGIAFGY